MVSRFITNRNGVRFEILLSEQDVELFDAHFWCVSMNGAYLKRFRVLRRGNVQLHRAILQAPKGSSVDHINGNTLDNRRENLRFASKAQNAANSRKSPNNKTSKYKGVCFDKTRNKWKMQIIKGPIHISKRFATEVEAARAYNRKATELFGEFAKLNKF